MDLPFSDPQFWIASGAVAATAAIALRRALRPSRDPALPCARCPKAAAHGRSPVPPAARRRLPLALLALGLAAGPAAAERVERRVEAMGTTLAVQVDTATREGALRVAEEMIAAVADAEARLSTWREESELSRVNRAAVGEKVPLSEPTWHELGRALACAAETGGAFDPTVAPLVAAWDLRGAGRLPSAAEIAAARAEVGASGRLQALPAERALVKRAPVRFDEGGFGKGAALARALGVAAERRVETRLDFGGQLAWTKSGETFIARIADPRDRSRAVVELDLRRHRGSLATSGNAEHFRVVDGQRIGHLLDPATGRPAPDFGSVTVVSAEPLRADCLSTALFVLGPERGLAWLAQHAGDDVVFLIVEGDRLVARATPHLLGHLRALVPDVSLRIEPRKKKS